MIFSFVCCRFQLGLFSFSFLTSSYFILSFRITLRWNLSHDASSRLPALRSIQRSIDTIHRTTTNDPFRASRTIGTQQTQDKKKKQRELFRGSLTIWTTKLRNVSSQRPARWSHQDYRPRRLRQVLWYSSITRQHFILQFSSVLHLQCQLPETQVSDTHCRAQHGLAFNLRFISLDLAFHAASSRDVLRENEDIPYVCTLIVLFNRYILSISKFWGYRSLRDTSRCIYLRYIFRLKRERAVGWSISAQIRESAWNGARIALRELPLIVLDLKC